MPEEARAFKAPQEQPKPLPEEAAVHSEPEIAIEEIEKTPKERKVVDMGRYNPTPEQVLGNWKLLSVEDEFTGPDPRLELAASLGLSDRSFKEELKKRVGADGDENKKEFQKFEHIVALRKMILGHDWRAEETASQAYDFINEKIVRVSRELALSLALGPKERVAELKQDLKRFSLIRQNLEKIIQKGYPELWQKIEELKSPRAAESEEEPEAEEEGAEEAAPEIDDLFEEKREEVQIPPGPEFLPPEVWRVAYLSGLNFLEIGNKGEKGQSEKEAKSIYFYIDPANPNLSDKLKALETGHDEELAQLRKESARLAGNTKLEQRAKVERRIYALSKETTPGEAPAVIKTAFKEALGATIKENQANDALDFQDGNMLRTLVPSETMSYPSEEEAIELVRNLKAQEPKRSVVVYARDTQDRRNMAPVLVYITKTSNEVHVKRRNVELNERPDFSDDTKVHPILGLEISPQKQQQMEKLFARLRSKRTAA